MIDRGRPLDRETYIAMNWGMNPEWTAEHEAALPKPFQRPFKGE